MSSTLNRAAYQQLIAEDLVWLRNQPRSLERDHIEAIVRASEGHEYPAAGQRVQQMQDALTQVDDVLVTNWITAKDNNYRQALAELTATAIREHEAPEISEHGRRVQRLEAIGAEITNIMRVYHEQEHSRHGVGTPGGLEHMGDVWRLFKRWETSLAAVDAPAEER